MAGKAHGLKLTDIIEKETELLEFVIDKNLPEFSLDIFGQDCAHYSKDLCDIMEEKFLEYLFIFFQSEGMADLATTVQQGAKLRIVYNVVRDMKKALNPTLYKKLIENSFYHAPPYLPLFGFMQQTKRWPMLSLSVMQWEKVGTKEAFQTYIQQQYRDQDWAENFETKRKVLATGNISRYSITTRYPTFRGWIGTCEKILIVFFGV